MKVFSTLVGVWLLFLAVAVTASSGDPEPHDDSDGGVIETSVEEMGGLEGKDTVNDRAASIFGSPYELRARFASRLSANDVTNRAAGHDKDEADTGRFDEDGGETQEGIGSDAGLEIVASPDDEAGGGPSVVAGKTGKFAGWGVKPETVKNKIARASLGRQGPPLRQDEFLSCACAVDNDAAMMGKPAFFPTSGGEGICMWLTGCGTFRATRGHEPSESSQPLWEVGGSVSNRSNKEDNDDKGDSGSSKDESETTTEVVMKNGQFKVVNSTPRTAGWFSLFGRRVKKEVTHKSPKPKGSWRTMFAVFDKVGRDIRDAELRVSPGGQPVVETPSGKVLYEIPLGL